MVGKYLQQDWQPTLSPLLEFPLALLGLYLSQGGVLRLFGGRPGQGALVGTHSSRKRARAMGLPGRATALAAELKGWRTGLQWATQSLEAGGGGRRSNWRIFKMGPSSERQGISERV